MSNPVALTGDAQPQSPRLEIAFTPVPLQVPLEQSESALGIKPMAIGLELGGQGQLCSS